MSNTMNKANAAAYSWHCAALFAGEASTKTAFDAGMRATHGVKHAAPAKARAAFRAWDGPIT